MSTEQIKEVLHLRIEQADERLLSVLSEVTESLFKSYQPEALEESRQQRIAAYEASLKPMTKEELVARAIDSEEDIKAGRIHDIEEVKAKLGL
ncbi:MAG: hypothetical protein KDC85_03660 [Saprospiraceae bacterium]|nr:hypothetical protein [Saprospiraceae bacterium]MCB9326727.1 hypothetical protein [Lewinellaceae bacterium]